MILPRVKPETQSTSHVVDYHATTDQATPINVTQHSYSNLNGKSGKPYVHRGGFCLETQYFTDSSNQPNCPSTILKPGDHYKSQTVFKFSARK